MSKFLIFIGSLLAIIVGLYFAQRGFQSGDDKLQGPIDIITKSALIETELRKHKPLIDFEYDGYKNHIYRVLTYTKHLLSAEVNGEALYYENLPAIEYALVYHDIGLWTDNALAYLEPSIARANKAAAGELNKEQLQITAYDGPNAVIINAVRKADWIDASAGAIAHHMPAAHIKAVMSAIADAGFRETLSSIGMRIHGYNIYNIIRDTASVFKL